MALLSQFSISRKRRLRYDWFMKSRLTSFVALVSLVLAVPAHAQQVQTYEARDTLHMEGVADESQAAQSVLKTVTWQPTDFTVRVQPSAGGDYDAVVTFPSPPIGEADNGPARSARLRWFAARDATGQLTEAPAVLVVHTLHPQMIIGDMIARSLAHQGVHAFVIELPGYGLRRDPRRVPGLVALEHGAQAVAEVRRARDAIAVLSGVREGSIALQGTSMGGFVAAVAGALDGAFDPVLLLLAGADGFGVLRDGEADAARLRARAHEAGFADDELRDMLDAMDPQHVAHRLDPRRTWLFTARDDQVVPRRHSDLLAERIDLPEAHHIQLAGNHYTSLLTLPGVATRMVQLIKQNPD